MKIRIKNHIMGVPITFMDKHNPEQFEIVGWSSPSKYMGDIECKTKINGKNKYARILIRRV